MSEDRRDWDREMADVDRAIAKQGTPVAGAPVPAGAPGGGPVRRRSSSAVTWFWVLLAVALGVALPLWPYQRACGLQLTFYLGAAGVTALIALLGALASWGSRSGVAHILSLAVIVWAALIGFREILPRVGYAKTVRTWTCESVPTPLPAPQPAPGAETAPAPAPQSQ